MFGQVTLAGIQDDKNGDGDPRGDPGEWGFVDLETGQVYTPAQLRI